VESFEIELFEDARYSIGEPMPRTDPKLIRAALETRIFCAYVAGRASREVEKRLAGNEDGLTSTGIGVLHALRLGPKTITEVSRFIPVAPSTLVPVVDALEGRGLLRRGSDPLDRRRTPLTMTDRGREALAALPPYTGYTAILEAMHLLGPEKGIQLANLLGDLVGALGGEEISRGVADAVRTGSSAPRSLPAAVESPGSTIVPDIR
jgi:DNA-binding MarR family transcriptional regulator